VLQVRLVGNTVQFQAEWDEDKEKGHYNVHEDITPDFDYPSELFWGKLKQ
jgi:hypothetical protein